MIGSFSGMLEAMDTILQRFSTVFSLTANQAFDNIVQILPQAALAILVTGIGLLIAAALYFLAMRVMNVFAVDKLAAKTPLDRILKNAGIHKTVSEIVSLLIFWFVVFFTLVFASDILQLEQLSNFFDLVLRFIPRVIAALLIVFFGMLLGKFLAMLVEQPLRRAHIKHAEKVGKGVYAIVTVFVVLFAFDQLGIDLSFVTTNVMMVLAVVVIILGVGTVFASRTLLENALACYQIRQTLRTGDEVMINDVTGRIAEFTVTSVILSVDDRIVVIPALDFVTDTYSLKRAA